MKVYITTIAFLLLNASVSAQGCCSGGSANPIAGGGATGVLKVGQVELATNFQYAQSNKFFTGDQDTLALFDKLSSNYVYLRADYGLSKKLTLSVASGYFLDKTLVELDGHTTVKSSGIGDLIVFPRYSVFNKTKDNQTSEFTFGLGYKIPLGSNNDSTIVYTSPTGKDYYATSPPTVQTTMGSQDFMFYGLYYKSFKKQKLRVFSNVLYVRRGYNSLGQKFGDYASLSVFAGKEVVKRLSVTLQLRADWIRQIKGVENLDLLAYYGIDVPSTGSRKLSFIPQLSYYYKSVTFFAMSEIPLYQHMNGVQVGAQYQFTTGLSYRFMTNKIKNCPPEIKD